jgi:hypothetical protein
MGGHEPDGMVSCRIVMRYDSPRVARAVAGSLSPDDEGFITTEVEGSSVVAVARAPDVMSLTRTLEDFLACAAAAERIASAHGEVSEDQGK